MGGKAPKIKFLSFSSTFSKIAIASSDSKFFKILTIASEERYFIISDCTDSLSSIKTSGSILKLFNLIIPVLLLVCSYCIIIYVIEHKKIIYEFKKIFNIDIKVLVKIILRWMFASFLLFLITFYFFNDKFFMIQNNRPEILWKIMILYPIFSALPQEFIFCKFFFYR
mgnify:CR=1 FL=1